MKFPEICSDIAKENENWYKSMLTIKCYHYKFFFLFEMITTFTQKAIPYNTPSICHHFPYHGYVQGFFHEGGNQRIPNHRTVLFVFTSLHAFSNDLYQLLLLSSLSETISTDGYSFLVCAVPLCNSSAL